jgi:hypothetical protein
MSVMAMTSFINAKGSIDQMGFALLFVPVAVYFSKELFKPSQSLRQVMTNRNVVSYSPQIVEDGDIGPVEADLIDSQQTMLPINNQADTQDEALDTEIVSNAQVRDINRRLFLRLIGTAGLGTFLMSVFTKEAQAAFFGSVPGPGTVSIKDSSGNQIDPAEKQPTDGYRVNEVDDASLPSYYGFINQDGAWYIAREDSSGSWRYSKGSSSFSTNWTGRAALAYDYFDVTF